jgi:chemotaxis protein CheD
MNSYFAPENGNASATHEHDMRPDAACKRLRECENRQHACEAIREIVSNLLGCEEMALFQVDRKRGQLSPIWSFGVDPHKLDLPRNLRDSTLSHVLSGETQVREHRGNSDGVDSTTATAFVPVRFDGQTSAVLVLLRLLPQKTKIDEQDRKLLAVISAEAGEPLFAGHPSTPASRERKR